MILMLIGAIIIGGVELADAVLNILLFGTLTFVIIKIILTIIQNHDDRGSY